MAGGRSAAGREAILQSGTLIDDGEDESFLFLALELAGCAWRRRHDDKSRTATVGCEPDLNIHGMDTAEKGRFVAELQYETERRMRLRPFLLNDERRSVYLSP